MVNGIIQLSQIKRLYLLKLFRYNSLARARSNACDINIIIHSPYIILHYLSAGVMAKLPPASKRPQPPRNKYSFEFQ